MPQYKIENSWRWSFIIIVAVLLGSGLIASVQIEKFFNIAENVDNINNTVETIDSLFSELKDAETGQRGFFLTGQENYLEPYLQSLPIISAQVTQLNSLSITEKDLAPKVERLKELVNSRLVIFNNTITDFKEGSKEKALDKILNSEGKLMMDEIRSIIKYIRDREKSLLVTKTEQKAKSKYLSYLFVFVLVGAAILLACLAFIVIFHFRKHQNKLILEIDEKTAVREALREVEKEKEELLTSERIARSEAERALRLKDDFVATLSHELRTPLNVIVGWTQILQRKPNTETLTKGLDIIDKNSKLQTRMIDDLLDMNRILTGKMKLDIKEIDFADVIDSAVNSLKPASDAKGVKILKILDRPGIIQGDSARLEQVVWNLLINAIKFTPKGGTIEIVLKKVDSHMLVSISDTGQGIHSEFLPYVFERFRQADGSITRRHGGLGIGLSIVKNILELHGGTIKAFSSGEDQGATFSIDLPLSIAQAKGDVVLLKEAKDDISLLDNLSLQGIKVLTLDDEPDARELLQRILQASGAEVIIASSAQEALNLLKNGVFPDAIVSDIGMPDIDGYDFIRQVRNMEGNLANIPAVALTALARVEDRKRALMSGFHTHVTKPIDPAELVAIIANLTGLTARKINS